MHKVHELKCWPPFFADIATGKKRFEIRWNDRAYTVGDQLHLREWTPENGYSGRELTATVSYIMPLVEVPEFPPTLRPGWLAMSLASVIVKKRQLPGQIDIEGKVAP